MKRRIISLMLSICTLILSTTAVSAETTSKTYLGKVAYVVNVNATGSNMGNDRISNKDVLEDSEFSTWQNSGIIHISGTILEENISINCTPSACSNDNETLFFSCSTDNSRWAVLECTYETNPDYYMYFQAYKENHPEFTSLLRFCLKDLASDTKNYIFIEIFGFSLLNAPQVIQSVIDNERPSYWYAQEFDAISTEVVENSSTRTSNAVNTYTRTYDTYGLSYTHSMEVTSYIDPAPRFYVGSDWMVTYRLTITDKNVYCNSTSKYTDYGYSELRISDLHLYASTIPGTGFLIVTSDGYACKNNTSTGFVEFSVGVSLGILSASLNPPSGYTGYKSTDTNSTLQGFTNNTTTNQFTKSIDLDLGNQYVLYNIGDYMSYYITVRDYGNSPMNTATFKGMWSIYLTNPVKSDAVTKTLSHNTYIAIS